MFYKILADLIVIIHLTFIIFALLGGLLLLWRKWIIYIHLPAAIWITVIVIQGWICPLTPLENYFRMAGNTEGYSGGFLAHYILPVIYPEGLTHGLRLLLGSIALSINIVLYTYVIYRRRHPKKNR